MSIAEGESVQVVDMSSQGLNEEHVNSTFIATVAASNTISSSQTVPGKSSPKMITVTPVKNTDASSPENKLHLLHHLETCGSTWKCQEITTLNQLQQ